MKHKIIILLSFFTLISCSQNNRIKKQQVKKATDIVTVKQYEQHNYGGWYCPDNLNGFPAVDIKDWKNVPVVNGRMATKKETRNGTSLIFVDKKKYPNAKPLDIKMPKLAKFYNQSSKKEETVIVIQALNIDNDSVVGFRYLNGGNGSAWLKQVTFFTNKETESLTNNQFVSFNITIDSTQDKIWDVLTKPEYLKDLQPIFNTKNKNILEMNFNSSKKVNYKYINAGQITSEFAQDLYGNKYIQIDFEQDSHQYVQKFLVLENRETKKMELQIVCGPYGNDFEIQKTILTKWADKVKILSEKL